MKQKIIIGILVLTNVLFMLFAFAQKVAADEQRELAFAAAEEAYKQRAIAMEQKKIAEVNAEEARRQQVIAERNLQIAKEQAERCK